MGFYISPVDCSKEEWLAEHGFQIRGADAKVTQDFLPVCWVDNGFFTAAAVGYNEQEIERFRNDGTNRPKQWWMVPREDLNKLPGVDL